jgi:hypothetical protein
VTAGVPGRPGPPFEGWTPRVCEGLPEVVVVEAGVKEAPTAAAGAGS